MDCGYWFLAVSRQSENESQDQKQEVNTLPGMQDDGEPVTAKTSRGPIERQCRSDAPVMRMTFGSGMAGSILHYQFRWQ